MFFLDGSKEILEYELSIEEEYELLVALVFSGDLYDILKKLVNLTTEEYNSIALRFKRTNEVMKPLLKST